MTPYESNFSISSQISQENIYFGQENWDTVKLGFYFLSWVDELGVWALAVILIAATQFERTPKFRPLAAKPVFEVVCVYFAASRLYRWEWSLQLSYCASSVLLQVVELQIAKPSCKWFCCKWLKFEGSVQTGSLKMDLLQVPIHLRVKVLQERQELADLVKIQGQQLTNCHRLYINYSFKFIQEFQD